jgi:nickel transport protein
MMIRTFAAAAGALALAGPALAHDAWADPDGEGGFLIAWGHPGEEYGRYDTSLVTHAALLDAGGRAVAFDRIETGDRVRLRPAEGEAAPALARFVYEPGPTIETSEGRYTRGSKADHPGYRRAFHSVRSGATLTGWSDAYSEPAGFELELVSLNDPLPPGAMWRVRLAHGGEPLADTRIVLTDDAGGTVFQDSDAQGEAVFGSLPEGDFSLSATHAIPLEDDRDVDIRRLDTNLHVRRAEASAQ